MRHGLKPTGRVYGSTLAAMNVPARQRLAQLRLNLDRVRRISRQLKGKRYIVVNIPAYQLQAVDRGKVQLYSRVITGKSSTPTPVTVTSIRALNFYPYWNVPQSIAVRALVPKVMQDRSYLQRERIRAFAGNGEVDTTKVNWSPGMGRRYSFRQDPGPGNALGVIRLDMPNKYTVYMHDTPLQRLFRYGVRAYSAGCVRVHRIFDLSAWLLEENGGWSRARVDRAVAAGKAETVKLKRPVPVYLVYVTAWGLPDGTAQFRVDIYNKDGTDKVVAEIEGTRAEVSALTP
jgi:murein L,D-transpeptidase YcbB/YkuD